MKVPLADDKRDEWKTREERGGSDHGRRRGHCRTDVPKIPARIDQLHRLDHNRVEWRSGQKFQDTCLDVDDCVIEVWQHRFVLAAEGGGVEYDAGQIDELMAARFKEAALRRLPRILPHLGTPAVIREADEDWGGNDGDRFLLRSGCDLACQ